jgi:hypothetical protein
VTFPRSTTLAPVQAAEDDPVPSLRESQRRVLGPVFILSVITLPIHVPRGAFSLTPADWPMFLFIVLAASAFWRSRVPVRIPLATGVLLMLLGGIFAVTQSVVPRDSVAAIVQDVYLFVWFVLATNFIAHEGFRFIRKIAVTWWIIAVAVATYMWVASVTCPANTLQIAGHPGANEFCRALGPFFDPNLAGYYIVTSLFLLWACPVPRHRWTKLLVTVPFALAIHATQSITALAAVSAGVLVALTVSFVSRRRTAAALVLTILAIGFVVLAILPEDLNQPGRVLNALGKQDIFAESLGRTNTSFGGRAGRWREALQFFGNDVLIGIGPVSTNDALTLQSAPIAGELHNDYVAGFIERGVVGGIGVLVFFGALSVWAVRLVTWRGPPPGWRPAVLVGAMMPVLLSAVTLETLHFRHVWFFCALLIAIVLAGERSSSVGASEPASMAPALGARRGRR